MIEIERLEEYRDVPRLQGIQSQFCAKFGCNPSVFIRVPGKMIYLIQQVNIDYL